MKETLRLLLEKAVADLVPGDVSGLRSRIRLERPKDDQFGEYTSNIALVIARDTGKNPRDVAEKMKEWILSTPPQSSPQKGEGVSFFEKIEVAGPGHLNFYLSQKAWGETLDTVVAQGTEYGSPKGKKGMSVNNEFISANPTGPLHLGNGRGGFFGDALSNVLRKAGYDVTNEYYVNDAGEQLLKLGHSLLKDSEAAYSGEYIDEILEEFSRREGFDPKSVKEDAARAWGEAGAEIVLSRYIKKTLDENMKIRFDVFLSEKKDVIEGGYVDRAIEILREKNLTFENEGALWFRSTDFGDDKDRVLVKQDGARTYFASDCGYILHKIERGFGMMIETWGADHYGYVARFRAAAQALGFVGEVRFNIVQLVRLLKGGKEVKMSKRAGNVVSVDELIETVGHDVARFFFLMYSPDTHMNFDLGLAEERSEKNPVYYVQYAHARLSSILRKAAEAGMSDDGDAALLTHEKERALLRELLYFPEMIEETARDFSVHRLPQCAIRLADRLHSFYAACRVIDEENPDLTRARLKLVRGVTIVLNETLRLIGVSAPEKM